MLYADARKDIKTGDILAWTNGSWTNWHDIQLNIVRFFTCSEYSHVAIAWVEGGRVFVIESMPDDIRIVPLSKQVPFYHIAMNSDISNEIMLEKIGGPYSKMEGLKGFINSSMLKDNGLWQCAKHVQWIYYHINKRWVNAKSTPSDIIKFALHENKANIQFLE